MAQTINEIKNEITAEYIADPEVQERYELDPNKTFDEQFSKSSFESIHFYIVAFFYWVRQKLFDTHVQEVTDIIDNKEPHHRRWYANKILNFQYGFDLLPDSDQFDNTGKTESEIEESKIVKYVSVNPDNGQLLIKVARLLNGDLASLLPEQLSALVGYMEDEGVKDAGVELSFLSDDPEQLKLEIDIYYNPLVLDSEGKRIDTTDDKPVPNAIRNYLNTVEFNGTTILFDMEANIKKVDGVVIPHIKNAWYKYGGLNWIKFDLMRNPQSGYMRITDENLTINYIPRNAIQ